MPNRTRPVVRKSVAVAAVAALSVGSLCAYVARGQERVIVTTMTLSPGEQRMVLAHMTEARKNAGIPKEAERITGELADLILMDRVAQSIAADPGVDQQHRAEMTDSAVGRVHEEAFRLANDPKWAQRRRQEMLADPATLKTVLHQAEIVQMTRDLASPQAEHHRR